MDIEEQKELVEEASSTGKRDAAWPVFEEYRNELSFNRLKEVDDAYRDAAGILLDNPKEQQYASIIIDETQDLGSQALKLLRAMIPEGKNDLFCRRRTPEDLWKKPCCDGAVWNQYSGESTETLS